MKNLTRSFLTLALLLGVSLVSAAPTLAQTPPPEAADASCVSCHESLYMLHDTGKWYCLCGIAASCLDCHGGVADAVTEEAAHRGMIASPAHHEAARCQGCHPDDYQQRLEKFAALGGVNAAPPQPPAYQPVHDALAQPVALQQQPMPFWRVAGLSILALCSLGLLFFARRCYQHDCLLRNKENTV
jgi:hypothetical protein